MTNRTSSCFASNRFALRAAVALAVVASFGLAASARAQDSDALGFERTPPRLSFVDGQVSFYRQGAPDWSVAQVNTPLAAGDELYTGGDANLEVQIGSRAYLRAGEHTQLGLATLEPDYLQLRVSEGTVSLDLRTLTAGQTFELATPKGAFTIERSGYYRVGVSDDATTFIARRGGRASVTAAGGATATIAPSEQLVITGSGIPRLETYAAPELDAWDRWNYARTDDALDAVSARYVPSGVYGVDDLDHYGDWRVVPTYGAIWVPRAVAVGWAPYTTGRWIYDPYYGWTWVDYAPWGWAPYHYGRWVYVSGYWAWAPGPLVVRAYYAPALVAFFGSGRLSIGISIGGPVDIGWVALGWGEPIVPWWGPRGCLGVPRWGGWGGPRVVNHVVIQHNVVVKVGDIHRYENERVKHAFVAVKRDQFGRRRSGEPRFAAAEAGRFERIHGELGVRPAPGSLEPSGRAGHEPPRAWRERAVVATRKPRAPALPKLERRGGAAEAGRERVRPGGAPPVHVVEPSHRVSGQRAFERPPFGTQGGAERAAPPPPRRYEPARERRATGRSVAPQAQPRTQRERGTPAPPPRRETAPSERRTAPAPQQTRPERATPAPRQPTRREHSAAPSPSQPRRPERMTAPAPAPSGQRAQPRASAPRGQRSLPGEPANRVYRGRPSPSQSTAPPSAGRPADGRSGGGGRSDGGGHTQGGQRGGGRGSPRDR